MERYILSMLFVILAVGVILLLGKLLSLLETKRQSASLYNQIRHELTKQKEYMDQQLPIY